MPILVGILVIVVIYLYYIFIRWLFVGVGPGFFYVTALLFSVAVPVAYVRAVLRTYRKGPISSPRNWPFLFVIVLVALIHLDLIWLTLGFRLSVLRVSFAEGLQQILDHVVRYFIVNRESLALVYSAIPQSTSLGWVVLLSAAIKSLLIVPCVLLIHGFSSNSMDSHQPARLFYFHGQAFRDLKSVVESMARELAALVVLANRGIIQVTRKGHIFVWPLTVMAYFALVPPVIIATVAAVLLVAMHSLSLGLCWAVAMWMSFLLSAAERAVIVSRAGYAKCPHAECHEPVPLPIFTCPNCREKHDRLVPGWCGVFVRICKCGKRLPTLFWFGKSRLPSECPVCKRPMREELFGGSVHVPIYGGPSAGKTMYMMAANWQLLEGKARGVRARLIDENKEHEYVKYWKPDFESGTVREKTARPFPDAFLLSLRRGLGLPTSVYLYDPAGEALMRKEYLEVHIFMSYYDGLALLIDPLSLPSFAERYAELGGPDQTPTTSQANPEDTVERIVNLLEHLNKLSRNRASRQRIAVVLTKADLPGFSEEFGISLAEEMAGEDDWQKLGLENSARIREWLRKNQQHLLSILEARFADIRFFAVSSLGHIPQVGQGFSPRRVLVPLMWLLSTRMTFSHPLVGRIAGRLMEVGAAAAILFVFGVLPIWLVIKWLPW